MSTETLCSVCCEDIKHPIICMGCNYTTCSDCTKTYILSQYVNKCMNCNIAWDELFIREHLPSKWINTEYKAHKKKVLMEMEKSYMQESVGLVAAFKNLQILKAEVDKAKANPPQDLYDKLDELKKINEKARQDVKILFPKIRAEDKQSAIAYKEAKKKEFDTNFQIAKLQIELYRPFSIYNQALQDYEVVVKSGNVKVEKAIFTKACIKDGCKGFLRASDWKCEICETKVCKECLEIEEEKHQCNPDTVATAKLIEKETKACPSCGLRVYKTSGCNHMFCTSCNTGFDWLTGKKIEAKVNTNPYFYKWLQSLPEEERKKIQETRGDGAQRGCDVWEYYNSLTFKIKSFNVMRFLDSLAIFWDNLDAFIIPSAQYNPSFNRSMRVRYLADVSKLKDVETYAYKAYKKNDYDVNVSQIFQSVKEIITEWFYSLSIESKKLSVINENLNFSVIVNSIYTANEDLFAIAEAFEYTQYKNIQIIDKGMKTTFKVVSKSSKSSK